MVGRTWRGTGVGQAPFYEAYRFSSDTSVRILYYADSSLARVADSGSVALVAGQIEHRAGGGVWVAVRLTPMGIYVEPKAAVSNSFSWVRDSGPNWRATLRAPGQPEVVFRMMPWRP